MKKTKSITRTHAAVNFTTNFGAVSRGDAPPIDAIIMERLHAGLAAIDEGLREACFQRGLLSSRLCEAIRMASFLSSALPLARAAQISTGVPASVLIAEAYSAGTTKWFMQRAYSLLKDSSFKPVMLAVGDPAEYLEQLKRWSAKTHGPELVNTITAHDLIECDSLREAN